MLFLHRGAPQYTIWHSPERSRVYLEALQKGGPSATLFRRSPPDSLLTWRRPTCSYMRRSRNCLGWAGRGESLFVGALMVVLCVVMLRYFKSPRDWQHSALLGFLWGVAILASPQSALLMFAWSHAAASENSPELFARARRAMLVVAAGAAFACLPWFIRNYQRFHAVFFVRDNYGLELSTSNNPCARPTLLENLNSRCHFKTHPNPNPVIAGEVIDKGEIQFNREQLRQALAWISSNSRAFASLTGRRFLKFWFPYLGSLRYAIPTGILTIF